MNEGVNTGYNWSPREAWRRFRLEAEAAKNYPKSYALFVLQTHRDLLLEQLLPTLLYVKGVAILDDALESWLATNGHSTVTLSPDGMLKAIFLMT
jgi:hypothetical protein